MSYQPYNQYQPVRNYNNPYPPNQQYAGYQPGPSQPYAQPQPNAYSQPNVYTQPNTYGQANAYGQQGARFGGAANFSRYTPKADESSPDLYDEGRSEFVRKVYTLLAISLVITTLICFWAMTSPSFKSAFVNVPAITILSVLLFAISIIVACCYQKVQKFGLAILIAFVIIESLLVGIMCSQTNPATVLTAAAITAIVVIGLTLFACFTKSDLTGCGPYIFIICMVLFAFGIVMIFWRNPVVYLIYACLAALLFCIYLVFDTQLVLGRFTNSYSFDDAYMAVLQLYTDIMQIFVQLIRILGLTRN